MAKKTVFRRLSKRLPLSSDLDDLIRRDDGLYDFEGQREQAQIERQETRRLSTVQAFDRFAGDAPAIDHDPETGEVVDSDFGSDDAGQQGNDDLVGFADDSEAAEVLAQEARQKEEAAKAAEAQAVADRAAAAEKTRQAKEAEAKAQAEREAAAEKTRKAEDARKAADKKEDPISSGPQSTSAPTSQAQADARAIDSINGAADPGNDPGVDGQDRRWPNGAVPSNADEYESYAETKIADFPKAGEVAPWWKSAEEIKLRKDCQVPQEMFNRLLKKAQDRVAELSKKK
jgi:hypothetical protein